MQSVFLSKALINVARILIRFSNCLDPCQVKGTYLCLKICKISVLSLCCLVPVCGSCPPFCSCLLLFKHTKMLSFPSLTFLESLLAACAEVAVGVSVEQLKLRFEGNSVDAGSACKMVVDMCVIIYNV